MARMETLVVNGESFDFDFDRKPMAEAVALEHATGMRYADWEEELGSGSAVALGALAWLVWRRAGRDVSFDDMLSGEVELDFDSLLSSLAKIGERELAKQKKNGQAPDPTGGGATSRTRLPAYTDRPPTGRAGSTTTRAGTKAPSPKSSTSGRGKSASSASSSSTG